MPDQRSVGIGNRLQETLGHGGTILIELRMHARDNDVHLLQHRVGEVERAVGQDVYFDASENLDLIGPVRDRANALDMLHGALVVQARSRNQGSKRQAEWISAVVNP